MINPMQYLRLALWAAGFAILLTGYTRLLWTFAARIRKIKRSNRPIRGCLVLTALILTIGTVIAASSIYVYYGFGYQPDIIRHGSRTLNQIAITFDDGPSLEYTPAILDILRDHQVQATFFLVGSHAEKHPEIAEKISAEGHEIGNHTMNHRNVPTLGYLQLHQEVAEATSIIAAVSGQYPEYTRPPRGMYDSRYRRLSQIFGQKVILWTISSRDWRYGTTRDQIVRNVLSRVKNGDIILFHDSGALVNNEGGDRSATVKALPLVIKGIQEKGLEIVPLRVLLAEEGLGEESPQVDREE